ncbi:MAG: DUF488 domain-containing protein [Anaerolineales bacterium]|nr:DUF488 domain-containing protein [Anaerolineales bacterium]
MNKPTPFLYDRQKQLLGLLQALGGDVKNLDFQKYLFLYCQETDAGPIYEFIPYKFGAFSFTSYADRRKLIERGLLANDENRWRLTDNGRRAVNRIGSTTSRFSEYALRYGSLRGEALVADTYRRYPYYATRSVIAGRVLGSDDEALQRIKKAKKKTAIDGLFTIGYEGHSLESYLNQLLRADIALLCDVRRNPISRKYGFSKRTLSSACDGVGIAYRHIPELGIASEKRRALNTQADYDALFDAYRRETLPLQRAFLSQIREWSRAGGNIALTCYEHNPQQCHRHCISEELFREFGKEFAATHL